MTLIEWLEAKQKSLGLSDRQFSIKLGVSNTTWSDCRKTRSVGAKVIRGAVRAFREECQAICDALADPSDCGECVA